MKNVILFLLIFIISCKESSYQEYNNFEFKTLTDSYNSKTNTFIRIYNYNDSNNIKIKLDDTEKQLILETFKENNFLKLSNKIDCSSWMTQPKNYTTISLFGNNKRHDVEYISTHENLMLFCLNGKKFLKIEEKINEILYSKPEVKALPKSNIAYE